jgi:hypothetical protein
MGRSLPKKIFPSLFFALSAGFLTVAFWDAQSTLSSHRSHARSQLSQWFLNASVPAGTTIQFKFIEIAANGAVTWGNGSNQMYTVPTSGNGYVKVNQRY